jgi:FkbM family methyltransferase
LLSDIESILETEIYKFISKSDKPIIIDCGANVGISTIYFKKLYPESVVYSIEADPKIFNLLEMNIKNFGFYDVILKNKAVWVDDKVVAFKQEGGHSGVVIESIGAAKEGIGIPVKGMRLRDLLNQFDRIDLLKLDIEGAENLVLFDCGNVLAKCDHIFVEWHSNSQEPQQLHKILELLYGLGYRYHIKEAFTRKRPFVDTNCLVSMDIQLNLYFYKMDEQID